MTSRSLVGAMTAVVFACGLLTVGPAAAQQRRDGQLLPQNQSGELVVAGCLMRGAQIRGGEKEQYVLAVPRRGPVESVPDGTCSADSGAAALDIDNEEKGNISDAALGRWVEIRGRLESETDDNPDNLREFDVLAFRLIPVVPPAPPRAAAAPAPSRPVEETVIARAEPAPAELPRTASPVPFVGLAGVLLIGGALALRSFRVRGPQ